MDKAIKSSFTDKSYKNCRHEFLVTGFEVFETFELPENIKQDLERCFFGFLTKKNMKSLVSTTMIPVDSYSFLKKDTIAQVFQVFTKT